MFWDVTPLLLGRRKARHSWFFYLSDEGGDVEIVYRAWVLRSAARTVLVDAGPPLAEAARRGLTDVVPLDAALAVLGVEAGRVETCILTHLHWDHAAGHGCLPGARFVVQADEAAFFEGVGHDHPATARFFSHHEELRALVSSSRCQRVDGSHEITPGIRVVKVGGHTPGSQMVAVDTRDGRALITGDVVPLARNYLSGVPNGILVDLLASIAAFRTIRDLAPDRVYPAHDPVAFFEPRGGPGAG